MTNDASQRTGPVKAATYLWAAAGAAVVGFAAVYLTTAPSDNNAGARTAAAVAPATPKPAGESAPPATVANAVAALQGLNTGHMETFVFSKAPAPVPEVRFQDAEGRTLTLAEFKGKAVLLNLWATWCAPCREEMPALDRLQAALGGEDFEVVALSLDRGGREASQKFLDKIGVKNLKLYVDDTGRASAPLKVIGMPTTILIDKEGREIGRLVGPAEWDSPDAQKLIRVAAQ